VRVLIYSHFFPPSLGGVEKVTLLLARFLGENGHEATVVTQTPGSNDATWPFRVVRQPTMKSLLAEIRKADIVHLQGFVLLPFLLAKLNGRPVIWAHHGPDLTCPKQVGWKDGVDTFYERRQCVECLLRDHTVGGSLGLLVLFRLKRAFKKLADAHLSPSRYIANREGIDCVIIPNMVDTEAFKPSAERKIQGRILFVGRLIREKGADVCLEALNILRKDSHAYTLEIVGDGYERPKLERLARDRGLDGAVAFVGPVPDENDLVGRIQRASVVCLPSLWGEPFGITGLEAMSCGTPLVASNKGGIPEFASDVAALVPPGDARVLADALNRTLTGDNDATGGVGRRKVVTGYDYRVVGIQYVRMYESLLGKQAGGS